MHTSDIPRFTLDLDPNLPFWGAVQDLYTIYRTQETCPRSYRLYGSHPATWARLYRSGIKYRNRARSSSGNRWSVSDLSDVHVEKCEETNVTSMEHTRQSSSPAAAEVCRGESPIRVPGVHCRYTTTYITPLGRFSKLDCSTTNIRLRNALGEMFPSPTVLASVLLFQHSNCGDIDHVQSVQGGVVYIVVYGCTATRSNLTVGKTAHVGQIR